MGVLDTLAAATPARCTVVMCLDGATQARLNAIEATFQAAVDRDKREGTMESPMPNLTAAVDEHETLREQVAASMVTFTFERVPWAERVALQAEHPPRPGMLADTRSGFNIETFWPAIIRRALVTVVDAAGDEATDVPAATWDQLLGTPSIDATENAPAAPAIAGSLNMSQVNRLIAAVNSVNEESPAVPRSARFLLGSQDSEASSTPSSPGTAPAPAASTAGSPPSSPTTTTGRAKTPRKAAAKKASSARSAGS